MRMRMRHRGGPSRTTASADVEYTCPMHPQVRQMGPGNCPICGMALEPVLATAEQGESPELRDMTRRFWIGTALTVPVFALEMGGHLIDLHHLLGQQTVELDSAAAGHAGGAVGRLAVLRARGGVGEEPQPEHVLAHRAGHRRGLALQHRRHAWRRGLFPAELRMARRRGADLLRGGRGHHGAGAARPGARAAGAREDLRRHQGAARPGAEDGGEGERRRHRRDGAGRRHPGRRPAARASRREGAGRRRAHRGQGQRRRVDGDRRADAGGQGGRAPRSRPAR